MTASSRSSKTTAQIFLFFSKEVSNVCCFKYRVLYNKIQMNFLEHFLQKLAYLYISCTIFCPQSDCIQVYRTMFGISEAFYSIKETGTSEHFSAHVGSFI